VAFNLAQANGSRILAAAHGDNEVAVLGIVRRVAEATVAGRIRGVGHRVDTEHATIGGGRVLVPLRSRRERRYQQHQSEPRRHFVGTALPFLRVEQSSASQQRCASRAWCKERVRVRTHRVQTHAAGGQGISTAGPGCFAGSAEVGAVVPGDLPHRFQRMHMYPNALNAPPHGDTARASTAAGPPGMLRAAVAAGMLRGDASNGDGVLRSDAVASRRQLWTADPAERNLAPVMTSHAAACPLRVARTLLRERIQGELTVDSLLTGM
jgi:hypothetical protein